MIAQGIVLHINSHEIIESRCGEAQNARHFFGMEEVGGLVPVDPHATEVIAKQIVQRIPREEGQAVWDPVSFVGRVIEV